MPIWRKLEILDSYRKWIPSFTLKTITLHFYNPMRPSQRRRRVRKWQLMVLLSHWPFMIARSECLKQMKSRTMYPFSKKKMANQVIRTRVMQTWVMRMLEQKLRSLQALLPSLITNYVSTRYGWGCLAAGAARKTVWILARINQTYSPIWDSEVGSAVQSKLIWRAKRLTYRVLSAQEHVREAILGEQRREIAKLIYFWRWTNTRRKALGTFLAR